MLKLPLTMWYIYKIKLVKYVNLNDINKCFRNGLPKLSIKVCFFILEPEKQLSAKQRHYDQEEVRRFMQKQKADRMKQQREEERRKQRAQEMRSQQLEELRSKQKQTAQGPKRSTKSAGARGKGKTHDETFTHSPLAYKDLPRHHPFHEDLQSGSMVLTLI